MWEQVDSGVREIVDALNKAGIVTQWSCSGDPGHMLVRPTLIAHFGHIGERVVIENVLREQGYSDGWISLVWGRGAYNTLQGDPYWLIELLGRFDSTTAFPVAYSAHYQTADDLAQEQEVESQLPVHLIGVGQVSNAG